MNKIARHVEVKTVASDDEEFAFIMHWAKRLLGETVLIIESDVSCVPLIFFKETYQGRDFCYGVVWYKRDLTIEEYFRAFMDEKATLARTPPLLAFKASLMRVFALYVRGKFGERELTMRVALGRYE